MENIHKLNDEYIDLSKIIRIGKVKEISRAARYHSGHDLYYDIDVQLKNNPITIKSELYMKQENYDIFINNRDKLIEAWNKFNAS